MPDHPGTRPEANRLAYAAAHRYFSGQRNGQRFTHVSHHVSIQGCFSLGLRSTRMIVRKTIRILGVSLALVALLVFATGVVSDWNHHDSTNDARCPYCHLGHQAPGPTGSSPHALRFSSRLLLCRCRKMLFRPRARFFRKPLPAHHPLRKFSRLERLLLPALTDFKFTLSGLSSRSGTPAFSRDAVSMNLNVSSRRRLS